MHDYNDFKEFVEIVHKPRVKRVTEARIPSHRGGVKAPLGRSLKRVLALLAALKGRFARREDDPEAVLSGEQQVQVSPS